MYNQKRSEAKQAQKMKNDFQSRKKEESMREQMENQQRKNFI